MSRAHDFTSRIVWTGNRGSGTSSYKAYDRIWDIAVPGKPVVSCSNDPMLGGDPSLMNPEDLLISALSACHMLWYLHLASSAGLTVLGYEDNPVGHGESEPDGTGRFVAATLKNGCIVEDIFDQYAQDQVGTLWYMVEGVERRPARSDHAGRPHRRSRLFPGNRPRRYRAGRGAGLGGGPDRHRGRAEL